MRTHDGTHNIRRAAPCKPSRFKRGEWNALWTALFALVAMAPASASLSASLAVPLAGSCLAASHFAAPAPADYASYEVVLRWLQAAASGAPTPALMGGAFASLLDLNRLPPVQRRELIAALRRELMAAVQSSANATPEQD